MTATFVRQSSIPHTRGQFFESQYSAEHPLNIQKKSRIVLELRLNHLEKFSTGYELDYIPE